MTIFRNIKIEGAEGQAILLDAYYGEKGAARPVVIFAHGFKGFKDWGIWDLVARQFAQAGYFFLKFNFSHNGTTISNPMAFDDLEAFGQNSYSKEIEDMDAVIDWLLGQKIIDSSVYNPGKLALIGHSRGGGIGIIKTAEDNRIKALATWASVDDMEFAWRTAGALDNWRECGVHYIQNARTGQQMPLYWQFYQDFAAQRPRFDLKKQIAKIKVPVLIAHGASDPGVSVQAAHHLQNCGGENVEKVIIPEGDHVFGGAHPWTAATLPVPADRLVKASMRFLRQSLR